jgi:hypothetical protein
MYIGNGPRHEFARNLLHDAINSIAALRHFLECERSTIQHLPHPQTAFACTDHTITRKVHIHLLGQDSRFRAASLNRVDVLTAVDFDRKSRLTSYWKNSRNPSLLQAQRCEEHQGRETRNIVFTDEAYGYIEVWRALFGDGFSDFCISAR